MSVWRANRLPWKIGAVIGLLAGTLAMLVAAWSIGVSYAPTSSIWFQIALSACGIAGIVALWVRMVRRGGNGLIWSGHWLFGWLYVLPFGLPAAGLAVVSVIFLPICLSQIAVGYIAWQCAMRPDRGDHGVSFHGAVRALASIVVLVIFLAGFRLTGFSWPIHRTCLWEVSRATSLRFPGTATMANGYADFGPMRTMFLAKVEMDHDDISGFTKAFPVFWSPPSRIATDLRRGNGPGPSYVFPRWFTTSSIHKCKVFFLRVHGWDAANVLVSLDDPERAAVYIYFYED